MAAGFGSLGRSLKRLVQHMVTQARTRAESDSDLQSESRLSTMPSYDWAAIANVDRLQVGALDAPPPLRQAVHGGSRDGVSDRSAGELAKSGQQQSTFYGPS